MVSGLEEVRILFIPFAQWFLWFPLGMWMWHHFRAVYLNVVDVPDMQSKLYSIMKWFSADSDPLNIL